MKKGGIVGQRMMTGALRADGQRRMIGDAMKEAKPVDRSGATRELTHFTWSTPFRTPETRAVQLAQLSAG